MDPECPRAAALAIGGDRVLAVGTLAEAAAVPAGTPVRRPGGAVIVPALIDSHLHLQWAGLKLLRQLGAAAEPPPLSEALAALDDPEPHEPEPDAPLERRLAALRLIQPLLHRLGIGGVVDPAVVPAELAGYVAAHRRGELTVRLVAVPHPDLEAGAAAAIAALDGIGARTGLGDERLRLGGVKVYFDGLGMDGTALRREPWPGGESCGVRRVSDRELGRLATWCAREGWSLGVHVVGGGIDAVLHCFARVDAETPIAGLGFTLIHAYLEPSEANFERARELGVMVAAQPAIHWRNGAGLVAKLGPAAESTNPLRSWLDAGVAVGGGSDSPAFPLDPRLGLAQVRDRAVRGDERAHDPGQALDAAEALALYTTGAAAIALAADRRGVLRPGAFADWAALSVDPLTASPTAVRELSVAETGVGGATVHNLDD